MNQIDDNTLTAYLEGSLSPKDSLKVERAIEEDDELKAVVDGWLDMVDAMCDEMQQEDDNTSRMEACKSIGKVMGGIKEAPKRRVMLFKPDENHFKKILVAASLITFVNLAIVWFLNNTDNTTSYDVPMNVDFDKCPIDTDSAPVDSGLFTEDLSLYK